jgi:tRNA-dihydrouridine synthase A
MMQWTDRHCRYLHRLFAPHALLYTEMIVSAAIVRGDAARFLEHHPREAPVALQLGGCDPAELARAARLGAQAGFAEINLNVGCPSDRVQNGAFGACLMRQPSVVAECVSRMRDAVDVPVSVKCRIGVDDQDSYEFFEQFANRLVEARVDALIVHARAAILRGLSPKENREIPPLRHHYVERLKRERCDLPIVLNGGLTDCQSAAGYVAAGLDGVMLGRAAYHRPALLAELERELIDPSWSIPQPWQIVEHMVAYAREEAQRGVRLHSIARHMQGLMAGREGARSWRRFLSEIAARPSAEPETLFSAVPILSQGLAA